MRLCGNCCSKWTWKKCAVLFGCVELCLNGSLLSHPLQRRLSIYFDVLAVLCLGIFVAYMYGTLKVISIMFEKILFVQFLVRFIACSTMQKLHTSKRILEQLFFSFTEWISLLGVAKFISIARLASVLQFYWRYAYIFSRNSFLSTRRCKILYEAIRFSWSCIR